MAYSFADYISAALGIDAPPGATESERATLCLEQITRLKAAAATPPQYRTPRRYRILCIRSGASQFGAATAWAKDNGGILEYATLDEAKAQALKWNGSRVSGNVTYAAKEYP